MAFLSNPESVVQTTHSNLKLDNDPDRLPLFSHTLSLCLFCVTPPNIHRVSQEANRRVSRVIVHPGHANFPVATSSAIEKRGLGYDVVDMKARCDRNIDRCFIVYAKQGSAQDYTSIRPSHKIPCILFSAYMAIIYFDIDDSVD